MEDTKIVTLLDVAKAAGVSKGTVDRVIHNRGRVSEESRNKILGIIEELNYKPNHYASMLASKHIYSIVCLIPEFSEDDYFELINKGVDKAFDITSKYNITINRIYYNQYDIDSFEKSCQEAIELSPDGVILVTMFRDKSKVFAEMLQEKDIPLVFIDTKIDEVDYLAYYGMPMWQSGYLAASLLMDEVHPHEIAMIRVKRGDWLADPTANRRDGFLAYMKEVHPDCKIHTAFISPTDKMENSQLLDQLFIEHPSLKHLAILNSRAHLVGEYLEDSGRTGVKLVGFDVLQRNVDYLKKGLIDILIAQRTELQAYLGIEAVVNCLIHRQFPNSSDNYMSLDIITKHNVDYYHSNS